MDISGDLVFFEKMDGTQAASVNIAVDKARSAARFKRPTKALQDALAAGGAGLRLLALEGAVPVEGGMPLIADGKIVGRHWRVRRHQRAGRPVRQGGRRLGQVGR